MDVKKLPSTCLYWSTENLLLHCPMISQIMTRDRFEKITSCLYVANALQSNMDCTSPTYDILHKIRWMLDEVQGHFKSMWSSNQQLIVDESMVMYKSKYCPIR
jgi:hypothetical protein